MEIGKDVFYKKVFFNLGESRRSVCLALVKGKKNCLIDTGSASNFQDVVQFCQENGVGVKDLDMVINTHCHPDHMGSNLLLKEENPDLLFYAHPLDSPYIEDVDFQFKERPVPGFQQLMSGSVKVDHQVEDGEIIDIGEDLIILHTPGHSAGSISVFLPERDVLVIGDAIPGRDDIPIYEDVTQERESFAKLEETGAEHVVSAYEGYQSGIGQLVESGREVLDRIDLFVKEYLEDADNGREVDYTAVSRYVLKRLGKEMPPIEIFITSVRSHVDNYLAGEGLS